MLRRADTVVISRRISTKYNRKRLPMQYPGDMQPTQSLPLCSLRQPRQEALRIKRTAILAKLEMKVWSR